MILVSVSRCGQQRWCPQNMKGKLVTVAKRRRPVKPGLCAEQFPRWKACGML